MIISRILSQIHLNPIYIMTRCKRELRRLINPGNEKQTYHDNGLSTILIKLSNLCEYIFYIFLCKMHYNQ